MKLLPNNRAMKKETYVAVNKFFRWFWHQINHSYPEKDRVYDMVMFGCLDEKRMLEAIDNAQCSHRPRQRR